MQLETQGIQALQQAFRDYARAQDFAFEPASLYDPIRYAMQSQGKAVRPMLLLQAYSLGGSDIATALPAAYAVELFHNFTLVHDDIMDEADLRRGQPAVHRKFGSATAILAGDAMLIHTYGYLLQHDSPVMRAELFEIFNTMAIALCAGQQRDMDMEQSQEELFEAYLEMIKGKTGVLLTACLELGACLAELDAPSRSAIREAGDAAGLAFQIMDDALDTFSNSDSTGKIDRGDIRRGKKSAPYFYALKAANPQQIAQLKAWYALSPEQRLPHLDEISGLYAELDVEQRLKNDSDRLSAQAIEAIRRVNGVEAAKAQLISTIEALSRRAS